MKHEENQLNAIHSIIKTLKQGNDPLPLCIEIHPTDRCNHHCDYCFHSGTGFDPKRIKDLFSEYQYTQLFNEMKKLGIKFLSISGGGEPFMDKRILSIIKQAHNTDLETRIVTNGNFLDDKIIKELMKSKEIRISLDASTPETYSKIRHVENSLFFITIDNIKNLIKMKKKENSDLEIGVTFLLTHKNYQELKFFCEYMLELGVDSILIKQDIYERQNFSKEFLLTTQKEIYDFQNQKIEFRPFKKQKMKIIKCFIPYFKVAINPYGELFSCCLGSQPYEKNGYLLGDLHKNTLEEIWNKSKSIRNRMRTEELHCNCCNYLDYVINKKIENFLK